MRGKHTLNLMHQVGYAYQEKTTKYSTTLNDSLLMGTVTNLISENDPRYFTVTSDGSYDRHYYKLHLKSGNVLTYEHYDLARKAWFDYDKKLVSHIEVVDKPKKKQSKGGFA
jgi:hypothetical protein